jgi:outer membrane protein assembly factor BamB
LIMRDGPGGDPIVYLYHSGSNNASFYTIARIDGATQAARWQSQPLSKNAYQGVLVAGQDMLYVTDGDKLFALRLKDGTAAWQATLDVEPQSGCEQCLRLQSDRVLVLEKNGGVQAFDTGSGQAVWSTRLENTPSSLALAGAERLLTTRETADKRGQRLIFLDAGSGKSALELNPSCPRAHDSFDDERPAWNTPFFFSADGKTMYALYGFFAQCAQSWDLTTGKLRWQKQLEEGQAPPSWSADTLLQAEDALYIGNGKLLWALATADGATRTLADDKEYYLTPIAARDGMLIVRAAPEWDSQRQELWGLDTQTGERHWQLKLQAHQWIGGTSSGDWDARLTPKGLVVLQVLRDEAQLILETLNPRTGASLSRQENVLTDMHMPSLRRGFWADDMVLLEIDSDILAVDLATGQTAYRLK